MDWAGLAAFGIEYAGRFVIAPHDGCFYPHDAKRGAVVDIGTVVGTVESDDDFFFIASPFRGTIAHMIVSSGDHVRKGQPIALLAA